MKSTPERRIEDAEGVIPVVILNWNGEDETVECLKSVRSSVPAGFVPVVVDNGSDPQSVARLERACRRIYSRILFLTESELSAFSGASRADLSEYLGEDSLVFIQNAENMGFAKGNNVGIRFAELVGAEWVMLLNNDTVVSPGAFQALRSFLRSKPSAAAITPQIRYFSPSTRIQNCGGDLTYLGSRRYRFADRDASALPQAAFSVVTFVTGCALLFKHRVTGPLTEDFFFGEEDYEFALRMKRLGLQMVCVYEAVIYHKVGTTIGRTSKPLGAILVHYVSRLINVRNYYPRVRWHLTRIAAYLYLPVLLSKSGIDPRRSISTIRRVETYLRRHRSVGPAEFQSMITWGAEAPPSTGPE